MRKVLDTLKLVGLAAASATGLAFNMEVQETNSNTQKTISELRLELNRLEAELEHTVRQYHERIELLKSKLKDMESAPGSGSTVSVQTNATTATAGMVSTVPGLGSEPLQPSASEPSTPLWANLGLGSIGISVNAVAAAGWSTTSEVAELERGCHDPHRRGFNIQNVDLTLEGNVDPYFHGLASISAHSDEHGELDLGLEEAYAETQALPGRFQARAGLFMTEFGKFNTTHPESWDFVDAPIVMTRLFGPHGLANPGARVSWLAPTPFYSELFFTIQDSSGEGAFSFRGEGHHHDEPALFLGRPRLARRLRSPADLLITPRYAAAFDLTDTHMIMLGVSAALGPNNAGTDTRTEIYGLDFTWRWKSRAHHGGFPFLMFRSEALWRRAGADAYSNDFNSNGTLDPDEPDVFGDGTVRTLPAESVEDWGLYAQLVWGFKKGWVAAIRGDYVTGAGTTEYECLYGPDPDRTRRWRLSPALSWYPSEFSRIRLQYNLDEHRALGTEHSVWLQLQFTIGEHGVHKF